MSVTLTVPALTLVAPKKVEAPPVIVSRPVPALVKMWLAPVARTLPDSIISPVAVIVIVRAVPSVSLQILPLIVTSPLPELVKPSLWFPEPLALTAEIVTP